MDETLKRSLAFPLSNIFSLVFGGLLNVFSILVIPIFFVYGYFVKIAEESIKNKSEIMPEWKKWKELFIYGVEHVFLFCLFFVLPSWFLGKFNFIIDTIFSIWIILFLMLYPFTICTLADKKKISFCFKFGSVLLLIKKVYWEYFLGGVVFASLGFIFSYLNPFLEWTVFLPSLINFFWYCSMINYFSLLYKKSVKI